jgi:hypothetical protein
MVAQVGFMRFLSTRQDYYEGYVRGLYRSYYGETFGTFEEHRRWLALLFDDDPAQAERGRGYRDGLSGIRLDM